MIGTVGDLFRDLNSKLNSELKESVRTKMQVYKYALCRYGSESWAMDTERSSNSLTAETRFSRRVEGKTGRERSTELLRDNLQFKPLREMVCSNHGGITE